MSSATRIVAIVVPILTILLLTYKMMKINSFFTIYNLYALDNRLLIPAYLQWGTYKPWLLVSYAEAVVEGDRGSFSLLYHNASSLSEDSMRYNVTQITSPDYHLVINANLQDGRNISNSILQDDHLNLALVSEFMKWDALPETQSWGSFFLFSQNHQNSDSESSQSATEMLSVVMMLKLEALDVPSSDTWLNVTDGNDNSLTVRIVNKTDESAFNGYKIQGNDFYDMRYAYIDDVSKLNAWNSQGPVMARMTLNDSSGVYVLPYSFSERVEANKTTCIVAIQFLINQTESQGEFSSETTRIFYYKSTDPDRILDESGFNAAANISFSSFDYVIKNANANFTVMLNETYPTEANYSHCVSQGFSNLQAGVGFYWGNDTLMNYGDPYARINAKLMTMTPSRAFFPRGFLWDEGFHQIVNYLFNKNASLISLESWLNLEDSRGWIGREQIRGVEARANLGANVGLYTNETNPPTLLFLLKSIVKEEKTQENLDYLNGIWAKLLSWYNMFAQSQQVTDYLYRWPQINQTSADEPFVGSGLYDFPRWGGSENQLPLYNLDLHCWVMLFAETMLEVSQYINATAIASQTSNGFFAVDPVPDNGVDYQVVFSEILNNLTVNLQNYFYDSSTQIYKEPITSDPSSIEFAQHLGYVQLFPFLFNYTNGPESIQSYLTLLNNPKELYSTFGIRSLSANDEYYSPGNETLWRGNIWVEFNFLVLRALKVYYWDIPAAQEFYTKLRTELLSNVCGQEIITNYLWQNFNPETGSGQGAYPYTGSTALVILIASEQYPF